MERIYIIVLCGISIIIPVWFMCYSLRRCLVHWHDGIDRTQTFTKNLVIKNICSLSSSLFNFVHVFYIIPADIHEREEKIIRMILFSLLGSSWIISLFLVNFEHRRRLRTTWYGLRSFWILNMILWICFTVVILLDPWNDSTQLKEWKIASFTICCCSSTILSIYSFCKPNEFSVYSVEPLLRQTSNNLSTRKNSKKNSDLPQEDFEPQIIRTSIKECKVKTENNRQVVYYHIIVTVGTEIHTVRKTYQDFETLHNTLREKFPRYEFPNLEFPKFPITMSGSANIDERKQALDEYLSNLCYPEFMNDELLNFLRIEGYNRSACIEAHKKARGDERRHSNASDTMRSNHGSFSAYYAQELQKGEESCDNYQLHEYIKLRIVKWVEEKEHIEYEIQWKAAKLMGEGTVMKRYSEIWDFHRRLRKIVTPAGLPNFPKKNYMQTLRKRDSETIEIRRIDLENYLGHVLNDPAYICQEGLDFIECKISIDALWKSKNTDYSYLLYTPILWDNEVDRDDHFIVYTLKFAKFEKTKKIKEWTVKRRYKDFDRLNAFLVKRSASPILGAYMNNRNSIKNVKLEEALFPVLPGKSIAPLSSPKEIDNRRQGLELYLEGLLGCPSIIDAFEFKAFINDYEE